LLLRDGQRRHHHPRPARIVRSKESDRPVRNGARLALLGVKLTEKDDGLFDPKAAFCANRCRGGKIKAGDRNPRWITVSR